MKLPRHLIKDFAKVTNDTSNTKKRSSTIRGTISVVDGKKYAKLDGADVLTPISEATDVQNGDRVLLSIENHTATVIGNYTCPASARTASNFIRLREDGLLVGELDADGNPIGTGSLIAPGKYRIIDEDGNVLASFSSSAINLGSEKARINFCGNKSQIYSDENGNVVIYGSGNILLKTADDHTCACNGSEIVTSKKLIIVGTITASGSIKAGKVVSISATLADGVIPDGYTLAGIREVRPNKTHCLISSFYTDPSLNRVGARLKNTSTVDIETVTVTIEWFAMYSAGTKVNDINIEFEDEDEDL